MKPYPVLTGAFWLEGQKDGRFFTPAEVLALADELKAFVNAQTQTQPQEPQP